jgi:outer membrane protein OmpA-like peptidoglycan-associated protein
VVDADDKCPEEAGPATNNGCPVDDDPDKDGVKGDADKCPDKAGPGTADGCPPPPKVEIVGSKVQINEKIMFEDGKSDIKAESNSLIENIANVLKENPGIELVEVAGHADMDGTEAINKPLTQKRAKAVMEALKKLGVDEKRMRSEGYSSHCPVDPGTTEEQKAKNRRVEIIILIKDGQPTDMKWGGCEAAEKKGWKPKALPATAKAPEKKKGPAVKAAD